MDLSRGEGGGSNTPVTHLDPFPRVKLPLKFRFRMTEGRWPQLLSVVADRIPEQ